MRITFVTRKFGNVERNSHCDVLHITPIRVARLFLDCNGDFAIKAYSRTPLIRPPSESHWCGRIRGMVAREGFRYAALLQQRHTKYGRIRGMVVGEGGRSTGVLLYWLIESRMHVCSLFDPLSSAVNIGFRFRHFSTLLCASSRGMSVYVCTHAGMLLKHVHTHTHTHAHYINVPCYILTGTCCTTSMSTVRMYVQ